MAAETRRQKLEGLRSALEMERSSFISHWRELAENFAPRRPRFTTSDKNKGDRINQKIVDSTPVLAVRTLSSGMMTGITSPAREWFRLTINDPKAAEAGPVKAWLDETTARMNSAFLRSNLYNALPGLYADIGTFGTHAMIIEEDFKEVFRCYSIPIGSFSFGLSETHEVEVFFREFTMTTREIIQKFGRRPDGSIDWSNISDRVKQSFENNQLTTSFEIIHAILPNEYFDEKKFESKYLRFRSTYYEKGATAEGDKEKFLSEKGYEEFPVIAARWQTTGGDTYGSICPGMEALSDVKQLQLGERRAMRAIDLMVQPPMRAPTKMRETAAGIVPGKITYYDESPGGTKFERLFDIDPRTGELESKQAQVRDRINNIFYVKIFQAISILEDRQRTATEINERKEERLLALGPVLEQLNQDVLNKIIDLVFGFMLRQNLISPPPPELRSQKLKVEYISIMQLAQKLSGLASIERFTQYVANMIVPLQQANISKLDVDQLVDVYADITSMRAGVVRSDDDVAAIREQQARAQAQQARVEQAQTASQTARNLSQTSLNQDSALDALLTQNRAGALA